LLHEESEPVTSSTEFQQFCKSYLPGNPQVTAPPHDYTRRSESPVLLKKFVEMSPVLLKKFLEMFMTHQPPAGTLVPAGIALGVLPPLMSSMNSPPTGIAVPIPDPASVPVTKLTRRSSW
ncbi:MAG: hypothetical protein ACYDDU_20390, partial [Dermatophilaceae bacterium]